MNVRGVFIMPNGAAGDRHQEEAAIAGFFGRLSEPVDEIVVALPSYAMQPLHQVLRAVATIPANVTLSTGMGGYSVAANDRWPGRGVSVCRRPIGGCRQLIKRSMDIALACAGLVCLAPLMAGIAIAIKLDSRGPVLFRQTRYGMNNQLLTILKFRTMHASAALDATVPQARKHDPRVTRIGNFLRRSSLDELPQLINVLRGEMSLVGPRPHAVVHDEQYAATLERYLERHRVKPGITGWAQVNGFRGETDTIEKIERRLAYDLYYIENWSLMLDIRILLLTLLVGIRQRNAY
jgi:Undecaprenyl-phosphate glucose phosphotransferase